MYCHVLRVRAIPTLESTDSMIIRTHTHTHTPVTWMAQDDLLSVCVQPPADGDRLPKDLLKVQFQ